MGSLFLTAPPHVSLFRTGAVESQVLRALAMPARLVGDSQGGFRLGRLEGARGPQNGPATRLRFLGPVWALSALIAPPIHRNGPKHPSVATGCKRGQGGQGRCPADSYASH